MIVSGGHNYEFLVSKVGIRCFTKWHHTASFVFVKDEARLMFGARLFGIFPKMGSGASGDKKKDRRRVRSCESTTNHFGRFPDVSRDQII